MIANSPVPIPKLPTASASSIRATANRERGTAGALSRSRQASSAKIRSDIGAPGCLRCEWRGNLEKPRHLSSVDIAMQKDSVRGRHAGQGCTGRQGAGRQLGTSTQQAPYQQTATQGSLMTI